MDGLFVHPATAEVNWKERDALKPLAEAVSRADQMKSASSSSPRPERDRPFWRSSRRAWRAARKPLMSAAALAGRRLD